MPTFARVLQVTLTVSDMRVSAGWHERVLGFGFVKEFRVAPGDVGIPRILLVHQHSGFLFGLCNHAGRSGDSLTPCGQALITLPSTWQAALGSTHG